MRGLGKTLEKLAQKLQGTGKTTKNQAKRVWIDVGSHLGEYSFSFAQEDPNLTVFAFEPNFKQAATTIGLLPNFIVIPMAVEEREGCANFYVNAFEAASSLYRMDEMARAKWIGGEQLKIVQTLSVPVIRLETFMNLMEIPKVEFLKIDAQGADLSVVKSAGIRLKDIERITLEVAVTSQQLYCGASSKEETIRFLEQAGFILSDCQKQSSGQEENLTFSRKR